MEIQQAQSKLLIDMVELAPTEKMDKKAVGQVKEALKRVEKYKEEIPHLHNTEEKQAVLKKCAKELGSIYEVIKPHMEPEAAKDLARELAFFKERINHHKAQSDKPTTKNYKMHYAEAMGNGFATPGAGNDNSSKPASKDIENTPNGPAGKTSSFKDKVHGFQEELTELTADQQETLKENFSLLKMHLNIIKNNKSCSAENLALIKEVEQFVEKSESTGIKQISLPNFKDTCEKLVELKNSFNQLEDVWTDLTTLSETLEDSIKENSLNNNSSAQF